MAEEYITSSHLEKLEHKILEIRERALFNIATKLENGVLFDNDLVRSKDLIAKLLRWFLLEPCTQEQVVFSILKSILKTESGKILVKHYGKSTLSKKLCELRLYIEPKYYLYLDELCEIVKNMDEQFDIPALEIETPLSFRTNSTNSFSPISSTVSNTATARVIQGLVQTEFFDKDLTGVPTVPWKQSCSDDVPDDRSDLTTIIAERKKDEYIPILYLKWQPLIESDRHVLQSVENYLKNPSQSSPLLSSCEFFTNILLRDFPAEIFLQRPTIILEFYKLLTCGSTRIINSVLNALFIFTKLLQLRIYCCRDTSLRNLKNYQSSSVCNSPITMRRSEQTEVVCNTFENIEEVENIILLEKNQLSFPIFCFKTCNKVFEVLCVKHDDFGENLKLNKTGINLCLALIKEIFELLYLSLKSEIWDSNPNETTLIILREFNEMLIQYGEALEYFRVEFLISETNPSYRILYLYLMHYITILLKQLIPLPKANTILPRNLKIALSRSLLDVTLRILYSEVYNVVLEYVKSFYSEIELLKNHENVIEICNGLSAALKFGKYYKSFHISEGLQLAKETVFSIEFHTNFEFLKLFVDMCTSHSSQIYDNYEMLETVEEIVLKLLTHNVTAVRKETYRLLHRTIMGSIGLEMKTVSSECDILFFLSSKIIIKIASSGITCDDLEIKGYASDILLNLIKCRVLTCETVWNKIVQALIPSLPLIVCHATKSSVLSKVVMTLIDPDTAERNCIPPITMLKCNVAFLFAKETYLRDEAFSRICWLLTSQEKSRELLPKFNVVYDVSLANVCYLKTVADINKNRFIDHFYQPTSLRQVMEVLHSENLEPVLRRSALNQMNVMMEDPLLHQIFLEMNGIQVVTDIMKSALNEEDYRHYPDSVIPIISILKNVCLHHINVREELSSNKEMFYFILRGLFLFFTEEKMKQDAATLLCVLIFKDFIVGTPSSGSFSLPKLISDGMHLPFICNTHWKASEHLEVNVKDLIISDPWSLSSLQIHLNLEIMGGIQKLIKWNNVNYDNIQFNFINELKLSSCNLESLKTSSITFCITKYLNIIQNGTSHSIIMESLEYLTMFVYLYTAAKQVNKDIKEGYVFSHPWEETFMKFMKCLPSCKDDALLLKKLMQFLAILVQFYKLSEKECWIINFVKDGTQCLLDLLSNDATICEETKTSGQELLKLISVCVCQEQHYLDYYTPDFIIQYTPWTQVIIIITEILKFSNAQHFYNLAYMDLLLSCLVNLTASLGWSNNKISVCRKDTIEHLIPCLCELIESFHCGKGSSAADSVMGLSITRHVLLIFNNLLSELINAKVKCWEKYFFDDDRGKTVISFFDLLKSRDVVVRAGCLQLFTGLAAFSKGTAEIVSEKGAEKSVILNSAFAILTDNFEANIVREYAAYLLSNLVVHLTSIDNYTEEILNLINVYDFYNYLETILVTLFTLNTWTSCSSQGSSKNTDITNGSFSESSDDTGLTATPGFIKAISTFLYNILNISAEDIINKLQERGLVKLLFRSLCTPSFNISNTEGLSLYCDILEMNTTLCLLLIKAAKYNSACLGTILHTYDCFNVLISLLNHKNFSTHLPQLIFLRNGLWGEIFSLLTTLIRYANVDDQNNYNKSITALTILCETIFESKIQYFLETLFYSVCCYESSGLQNSVLIFLTTILKTECYRVFEKTTRTSSSKKSTLQDIFDTFRIPDSILNDTKKNKKYIEILKMGNIAEKQIINNPNRYKLNLLEGAYFNHLSPKAEEDVICDCDSEVDLLDSDSLLAGAELCKILLHLYEICTLKNTDVCNHNKCHTISALACLLCISSEAKNYALKKKFLHVLLKQLKEKHVELSLESAESIRRGSNKKRICPLLNDVIDIVHLLTNFMINSNPVKKEAAVLNLADIIHKLWIWFLTENTHLNDVLRLLNVYTTECNLGCQSMLLTNAVAGSGPRKMPNNISLLHALILLIIKEMEQISKIHNLNILELSFNIICNCCESSECRILISKSELFNCILRLHPGITKKQKAWDRLELMWLDFLQTFTVYVEGQACVAKIPGILELTMSLVHGSKAQNKLRALMVLRNIAFYHPNRSRLLSSGNFLNILQMKITNGTIEEKNIAAVIIWTLVANNQKAKMVLKSAHLDEILEDTIKQCQLLKFEESTLSEPDLNVMNTVLNILKNN